MKTYLNKNEVEKAINVLRNKMWRILNRLATDGYNGDWQHAEDIEFVSQLSRVVHSSRIHSDSVTISDEAYDRLSTLTICQLSSVANRKTRAITEEATMKPHKTFSDDDRKALMDALSVILEQTGGE